MRSEEMLFDLMYANLRHSGFQSHRQYTLFALYGVQALLVASAISTDNNIDLSLSIPAICHRYGRYLLRIAESFCGAGTFF